MAKPKALFLMEGWPLSPDASGGAGPLCYSHLELLAHAGLDITLVILVDRQSSKGFHDFTEQQSDRWDQVRSWCSDVHLMPLERSKKEVALQRRLWDAWRHPDRLYFSAAKGVVIQLQELVSDTQPGFIWAEHLLPATLAHQALSEQRIVYSHHDWHWRIKSHRAESPDLRTRIRMRIRRRHEERVARRSAACVTASATEADEIRALGNRQAVYFPMTYEAVAWSAGDSSISACARIVHLGGMQTTANRIGLQRFLEVSWPLICREMETPPELWVIGSLSGASDALRRQLEKAGATCTGFVSDLRRVFRPYDIHIIPWEHNTGTRTRIPLVLNFGQVLVSTGAAAACLSELAHGENCVLVQDLKEMASEVIALAQDRGRRKQVALSGRRSFEQQYTREAVQPRFNQFIQQLFS